MELPIPINFHWKHILNITDDLYYSEDELLISTSNRKRPGHPKNEVWQHFNTISADSTNGKKDLHSGAACKFCKPK
ncbi:hypothetical protein Glove_92g25 [Diversispora epigaea]|uniref:Uncharacterized protein n=1 Tax=Diversispora epigaea TaxID=1348612 RepID=A0A397JEV0_9GLOM|nr:hypothetical protein Glove_92g25 [Diversispora epigaea]